MPNTADNNGLNRVNAAPGGGPEWEGAARMKRRMAGIRVGICVLLVLLLIRIAYIKYAHGSMYSAFTVIQKLNGSSNTERVIKPVRGDIRDRNNIPVAVSKTVYDIILDVKQLIAVDQDDKKNNNPPAGTKAKILAVTAKLLDLDPNELEQIADDPENANSDYIKIARGVSIEKRNEINGLSNEWFYCSVYMGLSTEEEAKKNKEKLFELNCVYDEMNVLREYPFGAFAPQVIGFTRPNGDIFGLERSYNAVLKGKPGRRFRTYDADGYPSTAETPPEAGNTLITTLDSVIQNYAQSASDTAFARYQAQHASVIVMDPNTGEILAMAQSPSFSSNDPGNPDYFTDNWIKQSWDTMTDEQQSSVLYDHWVNFNISTPFEPGSIFKPIVVAGALEEGVIQPDDAFYCGGSKNVGGQLIKCWIAAQGGAHGSEDVTGVLRNSCNVGMMDIVGKLGRNLFYSYRNGFGYGEKTGIDLPDESAVSDPWLMFSLDQLNPVELATSSFGQGFSATAIQDITAFSALINGGNLMKPYIVSRIVDSGSRVVRQFQPEIARRVISAGTSDKLRVMLSAVLSPQGTGKNAAIAGYDIGGKTGTAQQITNQSYEEGKETLTFIAYLPVENPRYIAMAVIDRPSASVESSASAAPMMRELLQDIITYKNIKPSDPEAVKPADDGSAPMPDYTGAQLRDAARDLNSLGMDYTCVGDGDTVISQFPVAGKPIPPGSEIILYLRTTDTNLTAVPDVTGLAPDEAVKALEAAGLPAVVVNKADSAAAGSTTTTATSTAAANVSSSAPAVTEKPSGSAAAPAPTVSAAPPSQKVSRQMPAAGQKVQDGTEVRIIVS